MAKYTLPSVGKLLVVAAALLSLGTANALRDNGAHFKRQSSVTCLAGSNSAPASEVYTAIQSVCATLAGEVIVVGSQSASISKVSTGDLAITIANIANEQATIDKDTCIWDLNVLVQSCSAIEDLFSNGFINQGSFSYTSQVLGNDGGLNKRTISNSSNCFAGNASAPVSEITNIVQNSLCTFFTNATLVPNEAYSFDYRIPEGDLVFKMKNICQQNVKLDNETCFCGFDKVIQQCVTADDRFVNGTIDNECIRLNTWVNATRLQQQQPQVPVSANQSQTVERRDDGDTFDCPPNVKTPYAQDPRVDTAGAVFEFCAQYNGAILDANIQFTHDIPLATLPSEGPASFDYINNCNNVVDFDAAQCESGLLATINSTYLQCLFVSGSTTTADGCQSMSYTVGI